MLELQRPLDMRQDELCLAPICFVEWLGGARPVEADAANHMLVDGNADAEAMEPIDLVAVIVPFTAQQFRMRNRLLAYDNDGRASPDATLKPDVPVVIVVCVG